jgi:hypothetical protein
VREAIRNNERDKPLTLNWLPAEPEILDCLGLPDLTPMANATRAQILTEAVVAGPDRWISYSRRKESYARGQRYFRSTYTYRTIVPAVDQLAAEGLLDHQKMPQGHRGFQSRFRASDVLLKELGKLPVIYQPVELIILRDLNLDLVDYRDNRDTRRMRKNLRAINEALVSQEIGIEGRIIREGDPLENGARARVQMHRVFNRSGFDLGGRFYGSFWQNSPKAERKLITIGGMETVEHDYASLHIRRGWETVARWRRSLRPRGLASKANQDRHVDRDQCSNGNRGRQGNRAPRLRQPLQSRPGQGQGAATRREG